jgi:asparagine synthase (glutamine-hydrolysing)
MCGILGLLGVAHDGRLRPELLRHRGPDGTGLWAAPQGEPAASLAHTRLAILDLSPDGNQPMHFSGRYVFVFNGEIYNFLELRAELEAVGQRFQTASDTEVFLRGLVAEGPAFQLRCNGMWAFCLWDRETGTALLGRDRFGKKPLFHTRLSGGALVFASEMKALYPFLSSLQPSRRIEEHFSKPFDYEHTDECVVEGIKRLPPGHWGCWRGGELIVRRWWCTLDHLETPPRRYEEQVERWRELFFDAVRLRMRADVRIGTALSGGLDSTAVFCTMAHMAARSGHDTRQATDWQHGFCARYSGSSLDESCWARVASDHVGVPLEEVEVDPLRCGWSVEQALYQVEDPYVTLPLPMLATYQAISRAGIKVTLDGHGADELFSGYGQLHVAMQDATPEQAAEIEAIEASTRTGVYSPLNHGLALLRHPRPKPVFNPRRRVGHLLKYLLGAVEASTHPDQHHAAYLQMDALSQALYDLFHISVLPTLLRNYDRYSMASGVEIRMPFMDWRLVCFTFSLPWTSKLGEGFTKRIQRDAMHGIVPYKILTRRDKMGWNAPMHEWLRGPLKTLIEATIEDNGRPSNLVRQWKNFLKVDNPILSDCDGVFKELLPLYWRSSLSKSYS